ncbi:MAG: sigma-70 family RNA polymerase sigma factor, partial [Candidatus Competibacteraceae bacterium]|nr:sigma-70 family RNA polymerase sigma factor [Candidatus Competibacteraceae bacterium]
EEVNTVARELGVSPDNVLEMESRLSGHDVSFDPTPETDGNDEIDSYAPSAYLRDEQADPSETLEQEDWEDQTVSRLGAALERLDPRSRDIVQRRWLNDDKPTLHELAAEYQVSAERIRQLETNAMKKLRAALPVAA